MPPSEPIPSLSPARIFSWAPLVLALVLTGCAASQLGWTEEEAENTVMIVDPATRSLGARRLSAHAKSSPELDRFLKGKGYPEQLFEGDGGRSLVLFYLQDREAYAFEKKRGLTLESTYVGKRPLDTSSLDYSGTVRSFFPNETIER